MTFVHRPTTRKRAQTVAKPPLIPAPSLGERQRSEARQVLTRHTARPVAAQRQAVQAPLRAATLDRQEVQRLQRERQAVQAQLRALPAETERPPAPVARSVPAKPATPDEWVTVLRHRAGEVEGQRLDSRAFGAFQTLQRQVAQQLAQGFRADRSDVQARYARYGEQLATLQRHALSAPVARVVLGLVPPVERLPLQRATDEALQRLQAQEQEALHFETAQALQRQLAELDTEATQPVLQRIQARRGAGNPLPEAIRRHLEQGLNHDLSRVRIHDDAEADKLAKGVNAIAFTTGADIFFRAGHFNPNTQSGLELLAHEVTHTVQQSQGRVGRGIDPDSGLEVEARAMGAKLARVMPSALLPSPPHVPGKYTRAAALQRVQNGAVQAFALKPLTDLQPPVVQRFSNPLKAIGNAIQSGVSSALNTGKEMLAGALTRIPGYRELTLAFGRDLVTGKSISQNPNTILDTLSAWVPGPLKDILRALKETNALPKAWTWFKAELARLDLAGVLREVTSAVGRADLGAAKMAVTRRIGGLKALIVGSAKKIAEIGLTALAAGLGPVGQRVIAQLRKSGDLIIQVLKNPAGFARNLLGALKGGFQSFAGNAPKHLQSGLGQWLTGASGITFPAQLDLQGVFLTALSVMGLTYQAMRGRLVRALGPNGARQVQMAEGTLDALKTLKGGLHRAGEMKANQGPVGTAVVAGLKSEVTKSVVMAGITKVASMLVPGGGFVQALMGAFRSVQFVMEQGKQIMGVITSAVQSVGAIAAGDISAAARGVESTLARSIPVALGFLGKVLGLGHIGAKVKSVIGRVRGRVDRVLDALIGRIKGLVQKLTGSARTAGRNAARTARSVTDRVRAAVRGLFGRKSFRGGQEAHTVWADVQPGNVRLMIASTPREASEQLHFFAQEARAKLGTDPRQVFNKSIQPHLTYALNQVRQEKQALQRAVTTLPAGEREAKMEMGVRASNITVRVARLTAQLLDELQKHSGGTHTMPLISLAFNSVPTSRGATRRYDQQELRLQLGEQENALRRMSVAEWLRRYPYYPGASRTTRQNVHKLDQRARQDYRDQTEADLVVELTARLRRQFLAEGLSQGDALKKARQEAAHRVSAFMPSQAALHMPDKIAGGDYLLDIEGLGDSDVNSFLGTQWNSAGKISALKGACDAVPALHRATSFLNVRLTLR